MTIGKDENQPAAEVSCDSLCRENVSALSREQKSRSTVRRLDAVLIDEPTPPEILSPPTLPSFNSLMGALDRRDGGIRYPLTSSCSS